MRKSNIIKLTAVLLIIMLILVLWSSSVMKSLGISDKELVSAAGIVTERSDGICESWVDGRWRNAHTVHLKVTYTFDGEEYSEDFRGKYYSIKQGDTVKLLVDKDKPDSVWLDETPALSDVPVVYYVLFSCVVFLDAVLLRKLKRKIFPWA